MVWRSFNSSFVEIRIQAPSHALPYPLSIVSLHLLTSLLLLVVLLCHRSSEFRFFCSPVSSPGESGSPTKVAPSPSMPSSSSPSSSPSVPSSASSWTLVMSPACQRPRKYAQPLSTPFLPSTSLNHPQILNFDSKLTHSCAFPSHTILPNRLLSTQNAFQVAPKFQPSLLASLLSFC